MHNSDHVWCHHVWCHTSIAPGEVASPYYNDVRSSTFRFLRKCQRPSAQNVNIWRQTPSPFWKRCVKAERMNELGRAECRVRWGITHSGFEAQMRLNCPANVRGLASMGGQLDRKVADVTAVLKCPVRAFPVWRETRRVTAKLYNTV